MTILDLLQLNAPQTQAATTPGNLVVTAGAGSGKTRTLVGRYLSLLEAGVPLRGIVAITFTEKAAREMRTRIRQTITDWLTEGPPQRAFWEQAFADLDAARIGTIHSLCAQILREHPVEAARLGFMPGFGVLEEGRAAVMRARAVEEALAWAATDAAASHLFGALGEFGLRAVVSVLLDKRLDADVAFEQLTDDPLQGWSGALQSWLSENLDVPQWQELLNTLSGLRADDPTDKMEIACQAVLAHAGAVDAARQQHDFDATLAELAALRASTALSGRKANWPGDTLQETKDVMRALRAYFDEHLKPLADPKKPASWTLDEQVASITWPLHATYQHTLDAYAQARRTENALDFDDLEAGALAMLDDPDVRATWQANVQAVLVDEFQDTNERQRQIVYALTGFTKPQLTAVEIQPANLFVVGDAKQCLVPGTLILTPQGHKPIEEILAGDDVVAASGRGQTNTFQVERVYQRHYAGPIMTISTASGFEIQCTPEHALFTRLIPDLDAYYVYLMRHPTPHYPHRWRVATERARYADAREFASRVAQKADTLLAEKFALTDDKRWIQTPAGQAFPGIQVPIIDRESVIPDEIVRVTQEQFEGTVYDLEISRVHNYIANHIVVHNSIYRFRGADVTVFRRVQDDVTHAGGRVIQLDLTFRAHEALVETTNRLLAPILGEVEQPGRPYVVPFAPLTAYRSAPRAGITAPFVELLLGLGQSASTGRQAAAGGLATRLLELRAQKDVEWKDVAMLFRASTAFSVYEDALERAGIPFVTVAGRGFYDRYEVRNLLNGLVAIADPTDDLALVGFLRSPSVGLTDATLYLLRFPPPSVVPREKSYKPCSIWAILNHPALPDIVLPDDLARAVRGRDLIGELHEMAGRMPVAALLKRLLDRTHYRAALQAVEGGPRAQRNVDKLLADAHTSGLVSAREFVEYVRTLRDVGTRESEAPTEAGSAVQLMTVHKAKGLEFPVVVIADAAHAGRGGAARIWLDAQLGVTINLRNRRDDDKRRPAAHQLATLRDVERAEAENHRLLYVAATRAREKLLVSAHTKILKGGRLSTSGWLKLLGRVTGLDDVAIAGMPVEPQSLSLAQDVGCTLYPWREEQLATLRDTHHVSRVTHHVSQDLVAPLVTPLSLDTDSKLGAREARPPRRVWRVVPLTKRSHAPAWVVGTLTHAALRHWRFEKEGLDTFLRPFALEMGVVDEKQIHDAILETARMLRRFRAHPLWAELDAAQRWPEVPFSVVEDGQPKSGIIDLLYRVNEDWKIAEFKTDQLRSDADLPAHIREKAYGDQVQRYARAVWLQLGVEAKVDLVFLNVGNQVAVVPVQ